MLLPLLHRSTQMAVLKKLIRRKVRELRRRRHRAQRRLVMMRWIRKELLLLMQRSLDLRQRDAEEERREQARRAVGGLLQMYKRSLAKWTRALSSQVRLIRLQEQIKRRLDRRLRLLRKRLRRHRKPQQLLDRCFKKLAKAVKKWQQEPKDRHYIEGQERIWEEEAEEVRKYLSDIRGRSPKQRKAHRRPKVSLDFSSFWTNEVMPKMKKELNKASDSHSEEIRPERKVYTVPEKTRRPRDTPSGSESVYINLDYLAGHKERKKSRKSTRKHKEKDPLEPMLRELKHLYNELTTHNPPEQKLHNSYTKTQSNIKLQRKPANVNLYQELEKAINNSKTQSTYLFRKGKINHRKQVTFNLNRLVNISSAMISANKDLRENSDLLIPLIRHHRLKNKHKLKKSWASSQPFDDRTDSTMKKLKKQDNKYETSLSSLTNAQLSFVSLSESVQRIMIKNPKRKSIQSVTHAFDYGTPPATVRPYTESTYQYLKQRNKLLHASQSDNNQSKESSKLSARISVSEPLVSGMREHQNQNRIGNDKTDHLTRNRLKKTEKASGLMKRSMKTNKTPGLMKTDPIPELMKTNVTPTDKIISILIVEQDPTRSPPAERASQKFITYELPPPDVDKLQDNRSIDRLVNDIGSDQNDIREDSYVQYGYAQEGTHSLRDPASKGLYWPKPIFDLKNMVTQPKFRQVQQFLKDVIETNQILENSTDVDELMKLVGNHYMWGHLNDLYTELMAGGINKQEVKRLLAARYTEYLKTINTAMIKSLRKIDPRTNEPAVQQVESTKEKQNFWKQHRLSTRLIPFGIKGIPKVRSDRHSADGAAVDSMLFRKLMEQEQIAEQLQQKELDERMRRLIPTFSNTALSSSSTNTLWDVASQEEQDLRDIEERYSLRNLRSLRQELKIRFKARRMNSTIRQKFKTEDELEEMPFSILTEPPSNETPKKSAEKIRKRDVRPIDQLYYKPRKTCRQKKVIEFYLQSPVEEQKKDFEKESKESNNDGSVLEKCPKCGVQVPVPARSSPSPQESSAILGSGSIEACAKNELVVNTIADICTRCGFVHDLAKPCRQLAEDPRKTMILRLIKALQAVRTRQCPANCSCHQFFKRQGMDLRSSSSRQVKWSPECGDVEHQISQQAEANETFGLSAK